MHYIDYIILSVYFLGVLILAGVFAKSQKSLKDFFLGSGNIPWWAAAFSGIATVASAISYIGGVGMGFSGDFSFLQYRLALPVAITVICVVVLPFFYNLKLYSIYEYLEKRFNLTIRLLGSALFILFKCCFLAIGIYAPAIIISVLTGMDILLVVLLTGVLTTLYTLMGGMKAVIWTDVPQLIIMLGGIFLIIWIGVAGVDGGLAGVLEIGKQHNKFKYFDFSPSLSDTYTVWGGIIGGTFLIISQFGTDQAEMQRFLTVDSLKKSNLALMASVLVATLIGFLIFFEGAVLFAFYEQRGRTDISTNEVFIRFVIDELPVGVRGFLVAALFAAAMSTISSVLNSLTTVYLSDFYNRFHVVEATVKRARAVTLVIGFSSTLLACLGGYLGNVLEAAMTIINFFGGALVGLFLLGMLSRKAGPKGALVGFVAGFVLVLCVASFTNVSYMWYSAFGGITTCLIGVMTSSLLGERPDETQLKMVYRPKKKGVGRGVDLIVLLTLALAASGFSANGQSDTVGDVRSLQRPLQLPLLINKSANPMLLITVQAPADDGLVIDRIWLNIECASAIDALKRITVYAGGKDASDLANGVLFGNASVNSDIVHVDGHALLQGGDNYFWVCADTYPEATLANYVTVSCDSVGVYNRRVIAERNDRPIKHRLGVAVRQHQQDGVHTSRIPGLATTNKGTLLAIFDARYESARDLQGHMDIGLHRSTDGGQTWQPLQIAMDMSEWGGLPQKFNGVSDACILVDKNSDAIYIAGLWMYGVIDADGKWVEGLTDTSSAWNHQWRNKGSQPGFGVKETSQFLIVKSTDDGKTWSEPLNLTEMCKREEWWLWAPAPGRGITMDNGTLVFPTQGRDASGKPFSNITYSKDGGKTWQTSNPALDVPDGTTECAVVQLSDGSLMLNMRANSNRGNEGPDNGRAIAVTNDLGETWEEHPTSFRALPEPTCMASLHVHEYNQGGEQKRVLLFLNPNSKTARDHITLKVSLDDGNSWPESKWLLLDEGRGRGYSCITSIDDDHIGVLYESSQADMVFQKINVWELIR